MEYSYSNRETLMVGIAEKIKLITAEQLDVKPEKVKDETKFVDDLGADSFDIIELIMVIEEQFDIEIPDKDIEKITTVIEAAEYVERKILKIYDRGETKN